jgi:hypothetical protein
LDALARLNGADTLGFLHFHCLSCQATFLLIETRVTKVNLQNLRMELSEDFIKVLNSSSFPITALLPESHLLSSPPWLQWGISLIA